MAQRPEKRFTQTRSKTRRPRDLDEACTHIRRQDEHIDALKDQDAKSREKLVATRSGLKEVQALFSASKNTNTALVAQLNGLEIEGATLSATVKLRDARIQVLETDNAALSTAVDVRDARIKLLETDKATLITAVEVRDARIQLLEMDKASLQEQIDNNNSLNTNNNTSSSSGDSSQITVSSLGVGTKYELRELADTCERDAKDFADKIRRLAK